MFVADREIFDSGGGEKEGVEKWVEIDDGGGKLGYIFGGEAIGGGGMLNAAAGGGAMLLTGGADGEALVIKEGENLGVEEDCCCGVGCCNGAATAPAVIF